METFVARTDNFMTDDTKIGGPGSGQFPQTQWSAIIAAGSDNQSERTRAFDVLVAAYWKPVYKYIRIKWNKSNEDAKDLTQGFFTKAMEKDFFVGYDPAKARFRTFLRTCLDGYIANEKKASERLKRGGNTKPVSLDFESADGELRQAELPDHEASLDDYFDKEWLRSLFGIAIEELQIVCEAKNKSVHFEIFRQYDLTANEAGEKISYDMLSAQFDLPVTQITNYLAFTRREFRRIVLEKLREITINDDEFRSEARLVLGVTPE